MAPCPLPTYVYKILPSAPPPAPANGEPYPLSDLDRQDGFVHLSTAQQVPGTADLFFTEAASLWLLRLPLAGLSPQPVKWEGAGETGFPHLYGNFGAREVDSARELRRGEDETWATAMAREHEWLV